ncbi:MAG: T9SS type A sorting domain-containing protein [Bacteroidetes bacterium]|nr:T9SS type A sorting domain-containing protein [Bacteroidota bacterium]
MKNKLLLLNCSLVCALMCMDARNVTAQVVGVDAYMQGNSVEIGISGAGGFEGAPADSTTVPAGMHFRSNNPYFGFVANPQLNSWSTFDGDFFTPGTPENGWGFEIDTTGGVSIGNNCASLQQIPGSITSWASTAGTISTEWDGDANSGTDLHFKINYNLGVSDLFYITTVSITNNTTATIPNLYYYRNIDPDNNVVLSGDYTTTNNLVSQIGLGDPYTSVTASASTPWNSFFDLLSVDTNWVAGYGGFSNRDGSDMYYGSGFTQTPGATNFADEAIYLAYKVNNLAPSATQTFKFASVFSYTAVSDAITALGLSTVGINDLAVTNALTVYPNPLKDHAVVNINKSIVLSNARFVIYDILGKEIRTIADITSHELTIDRNNIADGMYVYKLFNRGEVIGTGKLIIK